MNIRIGKALIILALFSLVVVGFPNAWAAGEFDFFEKEIRPLLHKHCYESVSYTHLTLPTIYSV